MFAVGIVTGYVLDTDDVSFLSEYPDDTAAVMYSPVDTVSVEMDQVVILLQ